MEQVPLGEEKLLNALKLDSNSEIALFHLGILYHRFKNDPNKAESYLRRLISLSPNHPGGLQHLARVLIDYHKKTIKKSKEKDVDESKRNHNSSEFEEATELFERSIIAAKDSSSVAIEYLNVVIRFGSNRQKVSL